MPSIRSIVNAKLIIDNKIQAIRSWEMFPPGAPAETLGRSCRLRSIAQIQPTSVAPHASRPFHMRSIPYLQPYACASLLPLPSGYDSATTSSIAGGQALPSPAAMGCLLP